MLFGRKKPGFSQIEEIHGAAETEDLAEGTAGDARADGSIAVAGASPDGGEKAELCAYLNSLPDAKDMFEGVAAVEEEPAGEEPLTEAQKLAEYIRLRTKGSQLTSRRSMEAEIEDFATLLEEMKGDESCQDIATVNGKDVYYYSKDYMSDNYAMIAALVEDKDLTVTIAKMVRFNCKTYPSPTPINYFERHPYYATEAQIDRAIGLMEGNDDYEDIKLLTNKKGARFLFSELHMTKRYAGALIEEDEYVD